MIYIWRTGHQINETVSMALHAGLPTSILKDTSLKANYERTPNKRVAIGYGILRGTQDIFCMNEAEGLDWWEVDRGYINPHHFDGYYRITKNGLQATYYVDVQYPDDRLAKLKFEVTDSYHPKGHVLVCPPTEHIEKFYNASKWLPFVEEALKKNNIRYKVRNKGDTTELDHDLTDCRCVVTFNSNVAVDATLRRIPVVVAPCSVAAGWARNILEVIWNELTQPSVEDVYKLLRFISYQQFTLDEMREGLPWRIMSI